MGVPAPREENLEPPAAGIGQIPSPESSSLGGEAAVLFGQSQGTSAWGGLAPTAIGWRNEASFTKSRPSPVGPDAPPQSASWARGWALCPLPGAPTSQCFDFLSLGLCT